MKTKSSFIIAVIFLSLLLVNLQSCETEELIMGTFTDTRDGQTYETVTIGDQTWFAENLNYDTPSSWLSKNLTYGTSESWNYDNNPANGVIYGRLYTWDAALIACPIGTHLPTDEEWKILEMELGMSQSEADLFGWRGSDEGFKLKSQSGWLNNGNGDNSSGFDVLPAGYRYSTGLFEHLGRYGDCWTATEASDTTAYGRGLGTGYKQVYRGKEDKQGGSSIRCIKD